MILLPLLPLLILPTSGMFAPEKSRCPKVDVRKYFAVSDDFNGFDESTSEYFRVDNLIETSNSDETNNLVVVEKSGLQRDVVSSCAKETKGNCEDGWRSFKRPSGEWCMKIFYENSTTQPLAEQKCQAVGATLSGLQNQIESQYVFSTVTAHIYPSSGSIWIGYKRRQKCLNVGRTQNCTAWNSFEWTDKSATGIDGVLWAPGQPDNARQRSQHCVILTAYYSGYVDGYPTGSLDDVSCEFDFINNNRHSRDIKAFVCGKKAVV